MKKEHGNHKLGDITVGSVVGGMRGMLGMIYEPSKLHHLDGINYRGHSLKDLQKNGPKTIPGGAPNPEGMFWLLLTGEYPNEAELKEFMGEINERSHLRENHKRIIGSFPKEMHPMTQFSAGMLVCQADSHFAKAYNQGVHKSKYWESIFEDSVDVCAKTARVAAIVYQNHYGNSAKIAPVDPHLDFSANFARQIGYNDQSFDELMRLYFVIHADHEGGNVSAHATHLVGSALSDPYLSFSAGLNGLAGPLHGLANQECFKFLLEFKKFAGPNWNKKSIEDFIAHTLKSGKVVPGYGHAVLRNTDPRFTLQLDFALKNFPEDENVKIVKAFYDTIPGLLTATGKVANPWPNVDAASGTLLMHYGFDKFDYYTVLFGISRAFGTMAAQSWSRALGLPIERPGSTTLELLIERVKKETTK